MCFSDRRNVSVRAAAKPHVLHAPQNTLKPTPQTRHPLEWSRKHYLRPSAESNGSSTRSLAKPSGCDSTEARQRRPPEDNWFLDIKDKVSPDEQDRLTARYLEEFSRYTGDSVQLVETRKKSLGLTSAAAL
jgi:hypothetical protein